MVQVWRGENNIGERRSERGHQRQQEVKHMTGIVRMQLRNFIVTHESQNKSQNKLFLKGLQKVNKRCR